MGIKRSTAYSIIRSGRPAKLPTGDARQAHLKVDEEICNFVAELLENNALLTLLKLNPRIRLRGHLTNSWCSSLTTLRRRYDKGAIWGVFANHMRQLRNGTIQRFLFLTMLAVTMTQKFMKGKTSFI